MIWPLSELNKEPDMLINFPKQGYGGPSVITDYSDSF